MQMPAYSVPLICEPFTGQTLDLAKKTDDCLSERHLTDYSRKIWTCWSRHLNWIWPLLAVGYRGSEKRRQLSNGCDHGTRMGAIWTNRRLTRDSDPSVNLEYSTHVLRFPSEPAHSEKNYLVGEVKRLWGFFSHWGYQALNSQSKTSSPTLSPFSVRGMRNTCPRRTVVQSYLTTPRQAWNDYRIC